MICRLGIRAARSHPGSSRQSGGTAPGFVAAHLRCAGVRQPGRARLAWSSIQRNFPPSASSAPVINGEGAPGTRHRAREGPPTSGHRLARLGSQFAYGCQWGCCWISRRCSSSFAIGPPYRGTPTPSPVAHRRWPLVEIGQGALPCWQMPALGVGQQDRAQPAAGMHALEQLLDTVPARRATTAGVAPRLIGTRDLVVAAPARACNLGTSCCLLAASRRLAADDIEPTIPVLPAGHRDEQHSNEQAGIEQPQVHTLIGFPGINAAAGQQARIASRRRALLAGGRQSDEQKEEQDQAQAHVGSNLNCRVYKCTGVIRPTAPCFTGRRNRKTPAFASGRSAKRLVAGKLNPHHAHPAR